MQQLGDAFYAYLTTPTDEWLVVEISVDVDPVAGPAAYIGFYAIAVLVFDTKTQQCLH